MGDIPEGIRTGKVLKCWIKASTVVLLGIVAFAGVRSVESFPMWPFKKKTKPEIHKMTPGQMSYSQLDITESFGDNERLKPDDSISFDWFERREDLAAATRTERKPSRLVPAILVLGLVAGLILALIGLGTVLVWMTSSDAPAPDVRAAIAERYPAADVIYSGQLEFEQETPVERVDLPALAKALPGVRFYTTELRTGYYEYPQVNVAVAVPRQGPIAVYLSPTYSDSDPEFTKILKNARVAIPSDERAAAIEIARLFAMITYKGEIRKPHYDKGRFSAELWQGDLLWRRVSIEFADGRVSSVTLANPKGAGAWPGR